MPVARGNRFSSVSSCRNASINLLRRSTARSCFLVKRALRLYLYLLNPAVYAREWSYELVVALQPVHECREPRVLLMQLV